MIRNNVTRFLDQRKIEYRAYEIPAEKLGALEAAQFLAVAPELVFKTIVISRVTSGKPILAVVPGPREVDLKAVAVAVGEKKVTLTTQRQAETLTGLQAGGISPLALLNRGFQVLIDEAAKVEAHIYISGGQRGLNIRLAPADLAALTNARYAQIAR